MSDFNPAMNAYDPNFGKRASVSNLSAAEKPSNAQNACDPSLATAITCNERLIELFKKKYEEIVIAGGGVGVKWIGINNLGVPYGQVIFASSEPMVSVWNDTAEKLLLLEREFKLELVWLKQNAPATDTKTLADQAKKLVYGDRNQQYGSPAKDYERVSKVWSGLLCNKLKDGESITAEEALIMMTALKLCREFHKHKEDNVIDAHGYLLCLDWVIKDSQKSEKGVDEAKK